MKVVFKYKPAYVSGSLCKQAIEFYGKVLLSKKIYNDIKVIVAFDIKKNDENVGYCSPEEDIKNPRNFYISCLKTRDMRYIFEILAHEMVHLKQFAKNELYFYDDRPGTIQSARWKKTDMDYTESNLINMPWEQEAYRLEKKILQEYLELGD